MVGRSPDQQRRTNRLYNRVLRFDASGLSDKEIAAICGCSEITVSRARRRTGLPKIKRAKKPSKFTAVARLWVKENFSKVNDKIIAEKFGIKQDTVLTWRRKLGLFYGHEGKWSRFSHPKGFKNGKHSEENKKAQSELAKKIWADPNCVLNSKKHRENIGLVASKTMQMRLKNPKGNIYSKSKRGYRADLGDIFFRSRWEANYARYLNLLKTRGEIFKWEYEADTFWFEKIKRGVRSYCPDFKVWEKPDRTPYYIEVKGWMDPKSKTKLARMGRYYPGIKIVIVDEKQYRSLKTISALIPEWER